MSIKCGRKHLSHDSITVLLLIAVTLLLPPLSSAAPTKDLIKKSQGCAVPAVREHELATLTCYFDRDVGLDQKSVKVLHYGSNSDGINLETNHKPRTVLVCLWHFGTPNCIVHSGYTFDRIITDELRLHIPDATQDHIGNYACVVSGSKSDGLNFCKLALVGIGGWREAITLYLFPALIAISMLVAVTFILVKNIGKGKLPQNKSRSRLHTHDS